jgi:hypothetical protein
MKNILLFKAGWWVLHIVVICFVFWLGHFVRF